MPRTPTRTALALGLVLLALTAGCSAGLTGSGDGDAGGSAAGGDDGGAGGGLAAEPTASPASEADGDLPALRQRQVVYTGQVTLRVDDFEAARGNLSAAARARGGFVSDARAELHGADEGQFRTGVVVLRVPRGNFTALMERVQAGGTVVSSETSSEDVTDQLVDIEARLDSLRTQRDRLRELYGDANDTEAVLAVEERLSAVQTDIERLEARQQSLERRVAYSTITVELREEQPEVATDRWYDAGVVAAFLASVDGVGVTLRALAVALAYAAPYLVVFGVPVGTVAYGFSRWRGRP